MQNNQHLIRSPGSNDEEHQNDYKRYAESHYYDTYEGTKALETLSDHYDDQEASLNDEKNIYSSHLRSRVAGLYSARELCVVSLLHHQLFRSHVDHRFHCEKNS